MKKIFKSKAFWVIVVICVASVVFMVRFFTKEKQVEYVTEKAVKGNIIQTVSATGQIKSASEIKLNFKNTGQIVFLDADNGQEVKKGQILAQLKGTDLAISVSRARADLEESQANLDKIKAGSTVEDVAVYEALVQKSQIDFKTAQDDLINVQATYSQAIDNAKQDLLNDINTAIAKASITLQTVYDTLNYEGNRDNFYTFKPSLENEIDSEYFDSLSKVDAAELSYGTAQLNSTDNNVSQAADVGLQALSQVEATIKDLANLLDYVIVNSTLTLSELGTLKTTVNAEWTTTNTSVSTVQGSKQDFIDAQLTYQSKVGAAQNAVDAAEKNLSKVQADLSFKQAPARSEDISLYQARVRRAQAELNLAQDKYEETILRAPIDGVITEVNYQIGEQTSLANPVIEMLAVENYEIEVNIPESDIAKVSVGDSIEITLDAFSDKDIFMGMATTINPAQTEIQDVVYYKVTVSFAEQQPESVATLMDKIKPGMTANITMKTAEANDVILIPYRAVKERSGGWIVQVYKDNLVKEIPVLLGLRGDEGMIEVVSGLNEGESVVVFIQEK